jgi:putative aldouronate transport system substrate-binding protein
MRKKFKLVRSVFVALLAVTMLAACSSNNADPNNNDAGESKADQTAPENSAVADSSESEPYNLTMAIPIFGAVPADLALVQDEINKITQEKINTTVTILPISIGAYTQQMNLMSSSGEKLDLSYAFGQGGYYVSQVSAGKTTSMDELLEKHGQGIVDAVGAENMEAARVNGEIHGAPVVAQYGGTPALMMRKDLVDKYQIDVSSIKSLQDLGPIFETIKQNEPGITPFAIGLGSIFEFYKTWDSLNDGYGVLPNFDNGLKIENLYETQEYADLLSLTRSWFKAGYINKDAAQAESNANEMVKAGKAFSYIVKYGPGVTATETNVTGYEMVAAELMDTAYSATVDVAVGLWTIAQQSEDPERAMMFLNLMYSDPQIANLLQYGIENKHYVKVSDNAIKYPEGVDQSNVGYAMQGWMLGNTFIAYKYEWLADTASGEELQAYNEATVKSKALGFIFDTNSVKTEITALNNVTDQYKKVLETGTVDPADKLPEFVAKLKSAGIEKVIAEKQKQLDAWAAANK